MNSFRHCRKITDVTCAGYFFGVNLLKQLSKSAGVAGYGDAFCYAIFAESVQMKGTALFESVQCQLPFLEEGQEAVLYQSEEGC